MCKRMLGPTLAVSVLAMLLFGSPGCERKTAQAKTSVERRTLTFAGSDYEYFLSIPADPNHALPLLFLVHGGGGDGLNFLRLWQDMATRKKIILLAPSLPLGTKLEKRIPELFPAFITDAKRQRNIDGKRVYIFGYSAGGFATFDAATMDSTYFSAATVLAGIVTPDYDWIVKRAQRKTPIAMYIGDQDEWFTVAQAERTRDVLLENGFPVHYREIPQQHHNYSKSFSQVQEDSWKFMIQHTLP